MEEKQDYNHLIPQQDWFIKIISFVADIFYNCIATLLSPFTVSISMALESYRRTETAAAAAESAVVKFPVRLIHGGIMLARRIGIGIVGAVHVLMVLIGVMVLAGILGGGLVQLWVEKPVFLKDRLFFDYTDLNPKAVFCFGDRRQFGIPIGHTFHVSLELLMPDSHYNRQIGAFQLSAELLSGRGNVIAKSSQPCMLTFRSLPIRLIRTCIMSIPLVLGISAETQKISVEILKHKEGYPRTKAIRFTLIPRAGTSFLPQLYESKILMNSELPWTKRLVRNWKWTISIWVALYIYILLLTFILCFCRPLLFPMKNSVENEHDEKDMMNRKEWKEPRTEPRSEREISEMLRKWQERRRRRRRKRKTVIAQRERSVETIGSSGASSMSFSREDASVVVEEDIGDSESVC